MSIISQKPPKTINTYNSSTKSTRWSKFWSTAGFPILFMGLLSSTSTIIFLASSTPAMVTVLDVNISRKDGKNLYSFVFGATDSDGNQQVHDSNMNVNSRLHSIGDVATGRIAQYSGKVMSDKVLAAYKWHGIVLTLVGLYLSRRLLLTSIGYYSGRMMALVKKLSPKP